MDLKETVIANLRGFRATKALMMKTGLLLPIFASNKNTNLEEFSDLGQQCCIAPSWQTKF
ncbi:MAG: hypothetical protein R2792_01195 [Saprospiraceae bacterium]